MPDQTARDAAVGYLTRRGVHETTARVWARGILAALGIPPDTTTDEVRAGLWLLAQAGAIVHTYPDGTHEAADNTYAPRWYERGASPAAAVLALAAKLEEPK